MTATMERPVPPPSAPSAEGRRTGGPVLGWRALLRLARRDALRHKGRSALVVLLVAIPVATLLAGAILMRSALLPDADKARLLLGPNADAVLPGYGADDGAATTLPAGWRAATVDDAGYGRVKLGDRYRYVGVTRADLNDPLLAGAVDVTSGRAPVAPTEAAVTVAAARKGGVRLGDTIVIRRGNVTLTVVGLVQWANDTRAESVVLAKATAPAGESPRPLTMWIDAPPGTSDAVIERTVRPTSGAVAVTRTTGDEAFGFDTLTPVVVLYTVGTIALFVVGIVVSAAFAVSARRQMRLLGLAGANGAAPRQLTAVVTAQGFVTGVAGAVVGGGLGAAAIAALAPHLNRIVGFRVPGLDVAPVDLVVVTGLAVATATVAAYLPARGAARVPLLAALGGRRPLQPVRAGVPLFGLALFAAGLALLGVSVTRVHSPLGTWFRYSGSTVLLLLGAVLCTPWLMGRLDPLAGRLRGAARLAARSMGRHRGRTGPITAAIVAAAGGAVALATFQAAVPRSVVDPGTVDRRTVTAFVNDRDGGAVNPLPGLTDRLRAVLGPDAVRTFVDYLSPSTAPGATVRIDGRDVGVLGTTAESLAAGGTAAAVVDAFRAGTALVYGLDGRSGPTPVEVGTIDTTPGRLVPYDPANRAAPPLADARSVSLDLRPVSYLPALAPGIGPPCTGPACDQDRGAYLVVPPAVAAANGWVALDRVEQFRVDRDLTGAETSALRRLAADLSEETDERLAAGGDATSVGLSFFQPERRDQSLLTLVLGGIVTLAALGVTAVGLALSSAEGRRDEATLAAVGAPPRLRRRVRAWEALLTAGIAGVVAVPVGFLPAAVVIANARRTWEGDPGRAVRVPWLMLAVVAVGVPALAGLAAYATGRSTRRPALREE